MVDRFEVFEREFATFDNGSYLERMLRLLRDGAGVGIHLVLAGDRVLGSGRFAGTTEDKIVLRLNDRTDYSAVGLTHAVRARRPAPRPRHPGAGHRARCRSRCSAATSPDRRRQSALTGARRGADHAGGRVPADRRPLRLDVLPDRISYARRRRAAWPGRPGPCARSSGSAATRWHRLGPDLTEVPTFVVAGPPRPGRSTALLTIARSLLERGRD